jgi:hypothetical protein
VSYPHEHKFTLPPGAQREAVLSAAHTLHLVVHYFAEEAFSVWVPTPELSVAFGIETGKVLAAHETPIAVPRSRGVD